MVKRKGGRLVEMIPVDEFAGLIETAHLLRSPRNADRLMSALRQAERDKGKPESPHKPRRQRGLAKPR